MPPIRLGIPDLTGGVSRQAPALRFPQQVEECDNALLNFIGGYKNRQGSEWMAALSGAPATGNIRVHEINRSPDERFILIFRNDSSAPIKAYKLDGTVVNVNWNVTAPDTQADLKAYVNSTDPLEDLRVVTIGDTSLLLNRTVTTAVTGTAVTSYIHGGSDVATTANAHNKQFWSDFTIPPAVGEFWYARESDVGHPYGVYEGASITSPPWYTRMPAAEANSLIDETTMPIRIVWNGSEFDVSRVPYLPRYNGDDDINPPPSFIGNKIKAMTYHRGRLWFGGEAFVVGSSAADLYGFWKDDSYNLAPDDPIDQAIPTNDVNTVSSLRSFQKSLFITCENGQCFEIRSSDVLSPDTVQLVSSVNLPPSTMEPMLLNQRLYLMTDYATGSKIYEYVYDEQTVGGSPTEVSNHADGYYPTGPTVWARSPDNTNIFISFGNDNRIYLYSMYWQGDTKVQSAAHRWVFDDSYQIMSMAVFDEWLYLTIRDGTSVWLERINIAGRLPDQTGDDYHISLDRKVRVLPTSFSGTTNLTRIDLPFTDDTVSTVFFGEEWGTKEGQVIEATSIVGNSVYIKGDWTDHEVVVGRRFLCEAELSRQIVRDQQGSQIVGTLQLKTMTVQVRETGFIDVTVSPTGRDTRTYRYTAKSIGNLYPDTNTVSGYSQFNIPVMASSDGVRIKIRTDSPAPLNVTGVEFRAVFVKGRRSAADN